MSQPEHRASRAWYLAPIFFSIIGGVIAYIVLRDSDRQLGKRCMILGFVLVFIDVIIYFVIIFSFPLLLRGW